MDGVASGLGGMLLDGAALLRSLGGLLMASLPMIGGMALLLGVWSGVVAPLVPSMGFLGGFLAGAIVYGGVSTVFIRAMVGFARRPVSPGHH